MEDNEFEEVTIISHTDLCSSVLPQATAERLMREIRLEVTQKISPTENVKLGSLQDPEAERRLKNITEVLLDTNILQERFEHLRPGWALGFGPQTYLYSSYKFAGLITAGQNTVTPFPSTRFGLSSCHRWGPYLVLFKIGHNVNIIDHQTFTVRKSTENTIGAGYHSMPQFSDTHFYFKRYDHMLVMVDTELNDTLCEKLGNVWEISLSENRELTNLGRMGYLEKYKTPESGEIIQSSQITSIWKQGFFYNLKQMYSDHFLVSEDDVPNLIHHTVHLVDYKTLLVLNTIKFETKKSCSFLQPRLLKPREYVEPFLVFGGNRMQLIGMVQQKLYHIASVELESEIQSVALFHKNTWAAVVGKNQVYSLIVEFPKALRVC